MFSLLQTADVPSLLSHSLDSSYWTPDHLMLGLVWTAYLLVGPLHKEARYRKKNLRRKLHSIPKQGPILPSHIILFSL